MAVELVAGAAVSASIEFLLGKIASSDVTSFLRGKKDSGFDGLLRKLKSKFLCLAAVLADAEKKRITNPKVEEWLDMLQDAVDDAEDLFDDIEYEALKLKVEPGKGKVRNFFSTTFNLTDRKRKIKMEEILGRLEDFEKERYVLDLQEGVREIPSRRSPSTSLIDNSEVYGRDDEMDVLRKTLLSDEVGSGKMCVISIVGMGGIGKTTLAQAVFNDDDVKKHFELKAWVCVSEEFDICKLTKTVLEAVTSNACVLENLNEMQVKIQERLKGKKFLIVLDDIWNDDNEFWNTMMMPFKEGAQGSKIIVTTRSKKIASIMGPIQSLDIEELKEEACLKLFTKYVSGNEDSAVLEKIGKEIIKKCKGLPLAVRALGSLLGSTHVEEWEQILKSDILDLPDQGGKIIPALRLSYHYLSPQLKRCFAYCSMFPKDYKFRKEELVSLWMAENILEHPRGDERLEKVGDECFNDLLSRSFFQCSSTNSFLFVMHDLMVDLARFLFGKKYFLMEKGKLNENVQTNQARHIAYCMSGDKIHESVFKATYLRTFLSFSYTLEMGGQLHDLFKLRYLRYLSLKYFKDARNLPKSIGDLRHLRYLDLSHTSIKKLPNSLCRLYNLQSLNLSRCRSLTKLPRDLHRLINLRYLGIEGSPIIEMPTQIGKLKNLQELAYFIVGKNNGSKIKELGELSHLRGKLSIYNIENEVKANKAQAVILRDKHIEELELNWGEKASYSEHASNVLDLLFPNTTLKTLCIRNYEGTTFPKWVGDQSYGNLVTLSLESKFCKTMPSLGQLPSLKSLRIEHFDAIETVGVDFYGTSSKAFASLEELSIANMPNWKQWSMPIENVEAFPKLKALYIKRCERLTGDLPCLLPSLIRLSISDCPELASSLPMMPTVTEVRLSSCQRLAGFQVAESFNFPQNMEISDSFDPTTFRCFYASLRYLQIFYCNNFEFPAHQTYESLQDLEIWDSCDSTTSFRLDSFPNIRNLNIERCKRLEFFTFSPNSDLRYPTLTRLQLVACKKLKFLPEQLNTLLPCLEYLQIHGCPELESFPRSGLPSSLHSLKIGCCDKLIAYRKNWNLQALPNLTSFTIWGYEVEDMESFPEQGLLPTTLTGLHLWSCEKLKFLPEQLNTLLPCLEDLQIHGCSELESFPRSGLPSSLHSLKISECDKLIASRKNWNLQALPNLTSFTIWGYEGEDMESFPEQGLLPTTIIDLGIIAIACVISLDEKGFQQLTSLEELTIEECPKLQTLPKEGLPTSLQSLTIYECPLLKKKCEREKGEYWNKIARIPEKNYYPSGLHTLAGPP